MIRYFDASALAKRYAEEPGTASVLAWLAEIRPLTSRLSEIEITSSLVRKRREGYIDAGACRAGLKRLADDVAGWHILAVGPRVVARTREVLDRHVLRAADAVHLASCLLALTPGSQAEFVTYDARLAAAAREEGLTVLGVDPSSTR